MTLLVDEVKNVTSAVSNLTLDTSGNVIAGANLTVTGNHVVAGTSTFTGTVNAGTVSATAVTQSGASTATSFIPTGSTVPANGMYRSAANTLDFATNTTNQVSISSGGIVTGTAGNLMLVQGSSQTAPFTTNTVCDFTGIPSWAKRVVVTFSGVGTSGTSPIILRLGAGSVVSTGYASGGWTASAAYLTNTTGILTAASAGATSVLHGQFVITNITGNTWVGSGTLADSTAGSFFSVGGGTLALGGALDRVRVTAVNGTDTFDTGSIINIQYE